MDVDIRNRNPIADAMRFYNAVANHQEISENKLTPITAAQKDTIDKALCTSRSETGEFVNHKEFGVVRNKEIQNLLPRHWIKDPIVNYYGLILQNGNTAAIADNSANCKCVIMNSFFYAKLQGADFKYRAVKRWTTTKKVTYISSCFFLFSTRAHIVSNCTPTILSINPDTSTMWRGFSDKITRNLSVNRFVFLFEV